MSKKEAMPTILTFLCQAMLFASPNPDPSSALMEWSGREDGLHTLLQLNMNAEAIPTNLRNTMNHGFEKLATSPPPFTECRVMEKFVIMVVTEPEVTNARMNSDVLHTVAR